MIPIKLELKNFLSYGSAIQSVDFKNYSLICLSGKNGNGKSALLDAITWALWGQARKVSGTIKPDEGLLRLGQTRMVVSLEFEFSKNIYRVRREYSKTYGKPFIALDLEIFDKCKNKFLPLTGKTVRLTQSKIEKLLGLDYLTFTNSAFLRQGQADEFSKKTPKERKQILSNILGLSRYDNLMSLALQKSKMLNQEYKIELKLQENDDLQISKEKGFKDLLEKEKFKLEAAKKDLKKIESSLNKLEGDKSSFNKKKDKYLFFEKELKNLNKKFSLELKNFKELVVNWKNTHYKFLNLESFDALNKEKLKLEEQDKDCTLKYKK
ncbi:AAA family ATPase, partial [Candidatus Dependentiae bacterium]|nr:AAA family ATPase [Candidatus Dependentiae bacterium]